MRRAPLHPSPSLLPLPFPSPWDLCLARRAATVAAVTVLLTLLVVAATDAGGPWPVRLGMTAALAPLAGAIGALAAVRVAAGRGELRALAAVGAEPARAVLGAALGGSAVGLLGAMVAASGLADLGALFPAPAAARRWMVDAAGLHELTLGLRIGAHGELALEVPRAVTSGLPAGATAFTLAALAGAALVCPAWLAVPGGSAPRRATVGAVAVAAAIAAFQGVAAGRAPAFVLAAGPLVLAVDVLVAALRARRDARAQSHMNELVSQSLPQQSPSTLHASPSMPQPHVARAVSQVPPQHSPFAEQVSPSIAQLPPVPPPLAPVPPPEPVATSVVVPGTMWSQCTENSAMTAHPGASR